MYGAMILVFAVAEIQAKYIDTGIKQRANCLGRGACGTERGDDLGFALSHLSPAVNGFANCSARPASDTSRGWAPGFTFLFAHDGSLNQLAIVTLTHKEA